MRKYARNMQKYVHFMGVWCSSGMILGMIGFSKTQDSIQ